MVLSLVLLVPAKVWVLGFVLVSPQVLVKVPLLVSSVQVPLLVSSVQVPSVQFPLLASALVPVLASAPVPVLAFAQAPPLVSAQAHQLVFVQESLLAFSALVFQQVFLSASPLLVLMDVLLHLELYMENLGYCQQIASTGERWV